MRPERSCAGVSRLAASCAIAALAACTLGPDYTAPAVPAPPAFAAAGPFEAASPPLRWWQMLGDDDLTALIERAVGGANLDLQVAQARIGQARAELTVAGAAAEPVVNATAQASRDRFSRNSELLANLPFPNPMLEFTDYRAGFDASWEIDVFGGTRREVEAAGARVQAAQAELRDVRVMVAAEVARVYIALRAGERLLRLGLADLADQQENARLVQLRRDAGSATEVELRRAQADAKAQAAALEAMRADNAAALDALAVLVGVTPQELRALVSPERPVPTVAAERVAVGLPSDLLRRRPDVRRAERELAAATAQIGAASANLYPRFTLVGNLGADSIHPGQFGQAASRTWSLAPGVSLPLLGRDRLKAEVQAREAARDAALFAYRKAVLTALADAETALVRFDRARARVASLAPALQDLEAGAELVRAQHAAGRSSSIDVLQAQRLARQMEEQLSAARADMATRLAALYKALGGGWSDADIAQAHARGPMALALHDGP